MDSRQRVAAWRERHPEEARRQNREAQRRKRDRVQRIKDIAASIEFTTEDTNV